LQCLFRHRATLEPKAVTDYVLQMLRFYSFLFSRTLSEKTAKPIIAKLEHNMYA